MRPVNWRWWAACRGQPSEAFVPEVRRGIRPTPPVVETLCPTCPVRDCCEQYGRDTQSVGWWGGVFLTYNEALRQPLPEKPDLVEVAAAYAAGSVAAVMARYSIAQSTAWRLVSRAVAAGLAEGRGARAPFTPVEIAEIRAKWAAGGVLQRELAAEYGAKNSSISGIVRGVKRDQTVSVG